MSDRGLWATSVPATALCPVIKLSAHYQDVLIDVGGRDTTTQRAALTIANLVLLPLPPRGPDIWTLGKVSDLLDEVRTVNPTLVAWAFLNRADAGGTDNRLSWVYGGNVAIAEFSPSLNFNIW